MRLGERGEGAAVDDPERLADAGLTASRARAGSGPGSSTSIPSSSARCAALVAHRAAAYPPRAPTCVAGQRPALGFPPDGDHRRPAGDPAAPARARPELRRPREAARPGRGRGARPGARGADRARRRRPGPQRRPHRLPARPGRPDRPRRRLAPPARGPRRPPARHASSPRRCATMFPAAELPRLPGEPRARPPAPRDAARRGDAEAGASPLAGLSQLADAADRDRRRGAAVLLLVGRARRSPARSAAATTSDRATPPRPRAPRRPPRRRRADPARPAAAGRRRRRHAARRSSASRPATSRTSTSRSRASTRRRSGQTYVIWLMLDREPGLSAVADRGRPERQLQDRFSIPSAVLPIVARVRFVDVSIAPVERRSASSSPTRLQTAQLGARRARRDGPARRRSRRAPASRRAATSRPG